MAILEILHLPDPKLKQVSAPVEDFDDPKLQQFIDDLEETRQNGPAAVGIAAPQVGMFKRVVIVDCSNTRKPVPNHGHMILVNPEITKWDEFEMGREGCLSVPDVFEPVERAQKISVQAYDKTGKPFTVTAEGLLAVCIQHEMDHLQGKLFVDYLSALKRQRIRKKLLKQQRQPA